MERAERPWILGEGPGDCPHAPGARAANESAAKLDTNVGTSQFASLVQQLVAEHENEMALLRKALALKAAEMENTWSELQQLKLLSKEGREPYGHRKSGRLFASARKSLTSMSSRRSQPSSHTVRAPSLCLDDEVDIVRPPPTPSEDPAVASASVGLEAEEDAAPSDVRSGSGAHSPRSDASGSCPRQAPLQTRRGSGPVPPSSRKLGRQRSPPAYPSQELNAEDWSEGSGFEEQKPISTGKDVAAESACAMTSSGHRARSDASDSSPRQASLQKRRGSGPAPLSSRKLGRRGSPVLPSQALSAEDDSEGSSEEEKPASTGNEEDCGYLPSKGGSNRRIASKSSSGTSEGAAESEDEGKPRQPKEASSRSSNDGFPSPSVHLSAVVSEEQDQWGNRPRSIPGIPKANLCFRGSVDETPKEDEDEDFPRNKRDSGISERLGAFSSDQAREELAKAGARSNRGSQSSSSTNGTRISFLRRHGSELEDISERASNREEHLQKINAKWRRARATMKMLTTISESATSRISRVSQAAKKSFFGDALREDATGERQSIFGERQSIFAGLGRKSGRPSHQSVLPDAGPQKSILRVGPSASLILGEDLEGELVPARKPRKMVSVISFTTETLEHAEMREDEKEFNSVGFAARIHSQWEPSADDLRDTPAVEEAMGKKRREFKFFPRKSLVLMAGACTANMENQLDMAERDSYLDTLVMHPHSRRNFKFDCISAILLTYDFFVIPLDAFAIEDNTFTSIMLLMTTAFWFCDMVRNFFMGYFDEGQLVRCFKSVCLRYLRSWFMIDFFLILCDTLKVYAFLDEVRRNGWEQGLRAESGATEAGRALRLLRNVRTIRLLRGLKATRLLKMVEDRIANEYSSVIWTMIKLFSCVAAMTHVICCIWYGLGRATASGNTQGWVEVYLESQEGSSSLAYHYATSFHWALTQFTPASIEVQPTNVYERVFGVIVLFFSLVTVSTCVSRITGAVMQLSSMSSQKSKQFWLLRRFLRENAVPVPLSARLENYCDFKWDSNAARLQPSQVQVLALLSQSLQAELMSAIHAPFLCKHPVFALMSKIAPITMRSICHQCVSRTYLGRLDFIFSNTDDAQSMYVFEHGEMAYFHHGHDEEKLEVGQFISEMCLWMQWKHLGSLQATSECELLAIDAKQFITTVQKNDAARQEAVKYARAYTQGIRRKGTTDNKGLSDLYKPPALEGLWFRLMTEFDVKANTSMGSMISSFVVGATDLPNDD